MTPPSTAEQERAAIVTQVQSAYRIAADTAILCGEQAQHADFVSDEYVKGFRAACRGVAAMIILDANKALTDAIEVRAHLTKADPR